MSTQACSEVGVMALLGPVNPWLQVVVVESTGSTNADLAAAARGGAGPWRALIAREQTAGRGRHVRRWESPKDSSLAISMLLRPKQDFSEWGWLSLLAGLAVAAAIESLAPPNILIELKWPNDVLIGGRKVCGILAERVEVPEGPLAVLGIGLNLKLTADELPVPQATSLQLAGIPADPNQVAAAVLEQVGAAFNSWQDTGSLRADYQRRCASIGRELQVQVAGQPNISGVGVGVDDSGALQVRTAVGIRTFAAGDVVHASMVG